MELRQWSLPLRCGCEVTALMLSGNRIQMVLISGQDVTLEPLESRSIQLTAVPKKEA